MPVAPPSAAADVVSFSPETGSALERLIFGNRFWIMLACCAVTLLLGWQATGLSMNASFEKMMPAGHPYIQAFQHHKDDLKGLGNAVRVVVEAREGTILDAGYLDTLQRINDQIFLIPGVDRGFMKSLWTPATRWMAVTEEGLDGGTVIPDGYDGSEASLRQVAVNIARSGEIGQLVAQDLKSSIIFVPLLDIDTETGDPLDYRVMSDRLESIRSAHESDTIGIRITGFAKLVGDLIDGLQQILQFFAVAIAITTFILLWYTRCLRSTVIVVTCSLVAVVWQLGLLPILGYGLDPFSVLVPFLVFAIGMSHGAQKMNGIMQDIGRGAHRLTAAQLTFRRLFLAGLTALLCDVVGFAVLLLIDIPVIADLAITASLGVLVLIFTNLILLPILLSYTGVSRRAAERSLRSARPDAGTESAGWRFLCSFTRRRWAFAAVVAGIAAGGSGYLVSLDLKIGDLDPGAPELRPDSRYNRDTAYLAEHYATSTDILVVMVRTPENQCARYDTLMRADALEWRLRQLEGVESTNSLAALSRQLVAAMNEGSPDWYELVANQNLLNAVVTRAPRDLFNHDCSLLSVFAYLRDHRADTLAAVVHATEAFAAEYGTSDVRFILAAGNAGIEAATNEVVRDASGSMLLWVYAAVITLCFITFRSWRAVVCAILPLALTSVLAEALMVALGIGVKIATLPVIALGVGIGIDYALYVLSVTLARMRQGAPLTAAYGDALRFTGKVVLLTGCTLAAAVSTWVLSPIKFQADMGILLAFMFLWNMLGALVLLPALAYFLLPQGRSAAEPGERMAGGGGLLRASA